MSPFIRRGDVMKIVQFVIIITFSDNVCPYLLLVNVFSLLGVIFFYSKINQRMIAFSSRHLNFPLNECTK